jgi:hypothetical protein
MNPLGLLALPLILALASALLLRVPVELLHRVLDSILDDLFP